MTQEALKMALEALEVATTPLAKDRQEVLQAITVVRKLWAEHAMRETQRLGQEIEQCNYPDCKCPTENPCLKGLVQPAKPHTA